MNSPLQLSRSVLESVHLEATGLEKPIQQQQVQVKVTAGHREDSDRAWRVKLLVKFGGLDEPCAPYRGSVEMLGLFSVHPNYPASKIDSLVRINGASILYGAIREAISNLTARGEHGVYILQSVSFVDMFKERVAKSEGDKIKPTKKKRPRKSNPATKRAKS